MKIGRRLGEGGRIRRGLEGVAPCRQGTGRFVCEAEGARTAELYENAQVYDVLFGAAVSQAELDFYATLIRQFGEPVLELACGTGRIIMALAQSGWEIHGLDLSSAMIERARQKAQTAGMDIPFHCADMRNFAIGRRFGFIFIPCQSFQHLYARRDVEECLAAVRSHLLPSGAFLIQVFNPYPPLLAAEPTRRLRTSREYYEDQWTGERYYAEYQNRYDAASQILHSTYYYHTDADPTEKNFQLAMRQFFPQELDALLEYNGWKIRAKYGDEHCTPFAEKPYYQNVLCGLK